MKSNAQTFAQRHPFYMTAETTQRTIELGRAQQHLLVAGGGDAQRGDHHGRRQRGRRRPARHPALQRAAVSVSALQLHLAREAALQAAWEAYLADIPMTWVRA